MRTQIAALTCDNVVLKGQGATSGSPGDSFATT